MRYYILLALVTIAAAVTSTTTPYPAGSTLANGGYICNPAHAYPTGQSCDGSGPTPTLVTLTKTSTPYAAGSTLANGGYICNPAHAYPTGQSCDGSGSIPTLVTQKTMTTTQIMITSTSKSIISGSIATYTGAAMVGKEPAWSGTLMATFLGLLAYGGW